MCVFVFGCCTCLTQSFLFVFALFRARSAAAYSSNYASNTVHELCVLGGVVFSVNFNVDMYLVLRSPISRR